MNIFWRKRSDRRHEHAETRQNVEDVEQLKNKAEVVTSQAHKNIDKFRGLIEENHITIKIQAAISGRH